MAKKREQLPELDDGVVGSIARWGKQRSEPQQRRTTRVSDAHPETRNAAPREHDFTKSSRGPRLQRVLAAAGIASRRECEAMIEAGDVRVNGHLVNTLPAWVDPARDTITVRGRKLAPPQQPLCIMLYKPRGVVCSRQESETRVRAVDLVDHPSKSRLLPVASLDTDASGLLLLTNDGELAQRLTHSKYRVPMTWRLTVARKLDEEEVAGLERAMLGGTRSQSKTPSRRKRKPSDFQPTLKLIHSREDRTQLLLSTFAGALAARSGAQPKQAGATQKGLAKNPIRAALAHFGCPIKRMRCVSFGPLKLKELQSGQWRELTPREFAAIRRAVKLEAS
jgi:pseudouridine synthase